MRTKFKARMMYAKYSIPAIRVSQLKTKTHIKHQQQNLPLSELEILSDSAGLTSPQPFTPTVVLHTRRMQTLSRGKRFRRQHVTRQSRSADSQVSCYFITYLIIIICYTLSPSTDDKEKIIIIMCHNSPGAGDRGISPLPRHWALL